MSYDAFERRVKIFYEYLIADQLGDQLSLSFNHCIRDAGVALWFSYIHPRFRCSDNVDYKRQQTQCCRTVFSHRRRRSKTTIERPVSLKSGIQTFVAALHPTESPAPMKRLLSIGILFAVLLVANCYPG